MEETRRGDSLDRVNANQARQNVSSDRLILLTAGAYSDYAPVALVKWVSALEPFAVLEQYLSMHPAEREDYSFNSDRFVAWMLREGMAVEVDCEEFSVGAYGCAALATLKSKDGQRAGFHAYALNR